MAAGFMFWNEVRPLESAGAVRCSQARRAVIANFAIG